jgi:alpha-L-fucosidase
MDQSEFQVTMRYCGGAGINNTTVLLIFLLLFSVLIGPARAEERTPADPAGPDPVQAWQAMRFGLFIHWGPVSLKGTEIGWSRGLQVPKDEYDALYKQFNPEEFDAAEWAGLAREAGMKYLVITAKHHDGFCLWDSKYTDYDIMATPFGRDVLKELSEACKAKGIIFCTYYSLCDWHHPDYPMDSPGGRELKRKYDMPRYYQYVKDQTRELIEQYGPLGLFWFDGEWEKAWSREYGNELYLYLKALQPSLVINNRVSKGRKGMSGTTRQTKLNAGDYDTPEQRIGGFNRERPWETCMTICRQWAWKPDDKMKSLAECLQTLMRVAGGDGNFLFNVGPMPDGRIEERQADRLREMGQWLEKYGRCIYGTRGGPFMPSKWCASTCRDDRIFLFIFQWPKDKPFRLPPIDQKVLGSEALTGGEAKVFQGGKGILVHVPPEDRDEIATVIELTVDGKAFDIEPVQVYRFGKPLEVISARASNIYEEMKEHGPDKACDGDEQTRWATDFGTHSAWLELDLGQEQPIGAAWISEAYSPRVQAFQLQYFRDGQWRDFFAGTTLGPDMAIEFKPIRAQRVRLNIIRATEGPTLHEFQLFRR